MVVVLARMALWCFQLDSMCRVAEGNQHVEGVAHSMLLCTMLHRHHVRCVFVSMPLHCDQAVL